MTSLSNSKGHNVHNARTLLEQILDTQKQFSGSVVGNESSVEYYGWFSEEIQSKRVDNPPEYKLKTCLPSSSMSIKSPPYTYWMKDGKKILVTDVTMTPDIMKRHTESNAVFLGKIDEFYCRSYTKLV
jgi:hypothetical protein